MQKLVHIYAVCPRALATGNLNHYLGALQGRFLGTLPSSKRLKIKASWDGQECSEAEILKLKEIVSYLESKDAILNIEIKDNGQNTNDIIQRINAELDNEKSIYSLGIVKDKKVAKLSDSVVTLREFQEDGYYNFDDIDLPQTASAFFDILPPQVLMSTNTFKLIDPYIFEMSTDAAASDRFEFIRLLEEQYWRFNPDPKRPIQIQVFGEKGKHYEKRKVMSLIKRCRVLAGMKHSSSVDFFVFNKKAKAKIAKKMHLRYFVAGKFCWNFEETSQNRTEDIEQVWRFIRAANRDFVNKAFRPNSPVFETSDAFTKDQITLK